MRRINLDCLFTTYRDNGEIVEPLRSYFHCDFRKSPVPEVIWSHDPIINLEESNQLRAHEGTVYSSIWKQTGSIIVSGYFEEDYQPFEFPLEMKVMNISLLKSQLQKCVRRKHTDLAILTAWTFMKLDFEQFIRRIAIIMNEDVFLHIKILPVITWITSAVSHGYKPSLKVIMWLLGIVKALCETSVYDPFLIGNVKKYERMFDYTDISTTQLKDDEINFLYSLLFRRSFGGLHNDVNMMNNSLYEWHERFINGYEYKFNQNTNFKIDYVVPPIDRQMTYNDIIIPSMDFHVCPTIVEIIFSRFENILNEYVENVLRIKHQITQDDIQGMIWHFNSGINVRTEIFADKRNEFEARKVRDSKNELYKIYRKLWVLIKPEYYMIAYKRILNDG